MEYSSNDVKQLFRSVYTLVKQQDERKSTLTVADLMANEFLEGHRQLVGRCVSLMFEDYETVGKKAREILWRKGYYDLIAIFKKHHQQLQQQWHNNAADAEEMAKQEQRLKQGAERLLLDGINHLKVIVLRLAQIFNLDNMKHLVSYGLLENYDDDLLVQESGCYENLKLDEERSEEDRKVIYTKQEVSFALESIHSLLTALGDLHRYYCEFGLVGLTTEENIKDVTAKYYWEAFKLNTKIGITQNQLGTLFNGRNYNLDSVYHYLYSLCCLVPFDCSDLNVNRIFQKNIRFLECTGEGASTEEDHAIREFVAKFLLVVDVFFYDKSVTDFTSLCHSVLIDFKNVLGARRLADDEYFITDDFIFKLVSILFFCMYKAQINSSDKIYSLNAFMVALCCELMEYCTMAVEKFRVENVREDKKFRELYTAMYQKYDEQVRKSRQSITKENAEAFVKDQKSSSGVEESNGSDEHSNKENEDHDVKSETSSKHVTSRKKHARRRRKALSNESDSELSDGEYDSDFQLDTESEDDASSISSFDSYDDFSDEEDDIEDKLEPKEPAKSAPPKETEDEHIFDLGTDNNDDPQVQLKFKKRYHKLNPNIIINFAEQERTMRSLMLLFDWLHTNIDILIGCYQSNPEFIHNIMKLLNHFNIDIFSNRYYFPRQLITIDNIRDDFRSLFEIRRTIPLQEDMHMKHFPLFEDNQESLDWEANYRLNVSLSEMSFLRLMKMVDFGFALCKSKKFEYSFCPKSRDFSLKSKKVQKQRQRKKEDQVKRIGKDNNRRTRRRDQQQQLQEKSRSRRTNDDRGEVKPRRNRDRNRQNNQRIRATCSGSGREGQRSSQEADGGKVVPAIITKKGYLKNKTNNRDGQQSKRDSDNTGDEGQQEKNINELMGQLWLRNEVKTLESKVKKVVNITMTPYLMLDSKCLTEHTSIVKNLVKTKKFVILIPTAVLSDLDELKKHSDGARNAIKWLEYEFSKGNRFLRSQKNYEMLPMPLFKIPKKLDREATVFYQIVQFCNHIVTNNADKEPADIITYLSGDSLHDRKLHNFSYIGMLEAIPVKFEQIVTFYSSYKRK
ncbi:nonsense-mediated mRNA decay factor SMG5 [Armigeres subalbatus]|uniref:nonsense-mediated mRNA decay factor SMG5 n=1 Tax=Armigeres subalbatus TaxID=124917 RepID=UPI002ED2B071